MKKKTKSPRCLKTSHHEKAPGSWMPKTQSALGYGRKVRTYEGAE